MAKAKWLPPVLLALGLGAIGFALVRTALTNPWCLIPSADGRPAHRQDTSRWAGGKPSRKPASRRTAAGKTHMEVCEALNRLGYRTRTGKPWRHPQQTIKLLRSCGGT
jgi:hypothetical protein